jgi:hypothetical protein
MVGIPGVAKSLGATVRVGLVADVHTGPTSDNPNEDKYYTQVNTKLQAAMDAWNSEPEVHAIVSCGDFLDKPVYLNSNEFADTLAIFNGTLDANVPRFFAIGNHEGEDYPDPCRAKDAFLRAIGQTASNGFANGGKYFSYDIPNSNVRLIILDSNYDSNGYDICENVSYLGDAQLRWLQDNLVAADAAGKYSFIFMHHFVNGLVYTQSTKNLEDSDKLLDILKQHRVPLVVSGHGHNDYGFTTYNLTNALGNRIYFKTLGALVRGNGKNNYSTLYIDDSNGDFAIQGSDLCHGKRTLVYTALSSDHRDTKNYINWRIEEYALMGYNTCSVSQAMANMHNYPNGVSIPRGGDIIKFTQESECGMNAPPARSNLSGTDWDQSIEVHVAEIHVDKEFTKRFGDFYTPRIRCSSIGALYLNGGFADYSGLQGKFGIGYIKARGGSGYGIVTQFTLLASDCSSYPNKKIAIMDIDLDDPDWIINVRDAGNGVTVDEITLRNGTVNVIDLVTSGSHKGVDTLEQYGGNFYLTRNGKKMVEIGTATIYGGTFDMSTGTEAGDGKTIGKLIIKGGDINLDVDNLIIASGIEVYATPSSFYNHRGCFYNTVFKGKNNAELTFDMDGVNSVTIAAEFYKMADNCTTWLEMDFNGDCKVDFQDLALFSENWLECNLKEPNECWLY